MHEPGLLNRLFIAGIDLYRMALSPLLPGRCRFYPSCSAYARESFELLPVHRALAKSLWRILRCNPWNEGYFDPVVPDRTSARAHAEGHSTCSH